MHKHTRNDLQLKSMNINVCSTTLQAVFNPSSIHPQLYSFVCMKAWNMTLYNSNINLFLSCCLICPSTVYPRWWRWYTKLHSHIVFQCAVCLSVEQTNRCRCTYLLTQCSVKCIFTSSSIHVSFKLSFYSKIIWFPFFALQILNCA